MITAPAILNERSKTSKQSDYHKLCTIDHPEPYFQSEGVHSYDSSHIRNPSQQYHYNKVEIHPTCISLPTPPPVSSEFNSSSLQKWYQKKPLFTLTAKGQVKRLEKYLQSQRLLEICKREYEMLFENERLKKTYIDFEFRELQPLLYEDKDSCCVCPCNSSKHFDIDFMPVDYLYCNPPKPKFCLCPDHVEKNEYQKEKKKFSRDRKYHESKKMQKNVVEEVIIPTKIMNEDEEIDDRGIYKIIMKNKEMKPTSSERKYLFKLFDNDNFVSKETFFNDTNESNQNFPSANNFFLSRITLDNVATLPHDGIKSSGFRSSRSGYIQKKINSGRSKLLFSAGSRFAKKYDFNMNEIR